MRAYSEDLRLRVLAAVDRGMPRAEVAGLFAVSAATIKRWLRRRRETGGVALRPRPGRPSEKMAALRAGLLPQLEAHPDATLEDHCRRWEAAHGVRVSTASMSRVIARHFGWTRKKSLMRLRRTLAYEIPQGGLSEKWPMGLRPTLPDESARGRLSEKRP